MIILTHLVAYNECGSIGTLVAVLIATLNSLLMGMYDDNVRVLVMRCYIIRNDYKPSAKWNLSPVCHVSETAAEGIN